MAENLRLRVKPQSTNLSAIQSPRIYRKYAVGWRRCRRLTDSEFEMRPGRPDWVPSRNEQAVARLDRIGQVFSQRRCFHSSRLDCREILVRALEKMNTIYRVLDKKEKHHDEEYITISLTLKPSQLTSVYALLGGTAIAAAP